MVSVVFLSTNILFPSFANVAVGQFRVLGIINVLRKYLRLFELKLTGCDYKNMLFAALLKFGVPREEVLVYSQNFGAAHW